MKKTQGAAAILLLCAVLLCSCGLGKAEQPLPSAVPLSEPEASAASEHTEVRIYFDGLLSDRGIYENDTLYMAPEALCNYFGLENSTELNEDGFSFSVPDMVLAGSRGREYMEAEHRYLYAPQGWISEKGRVYLPQDVIERIFGIKFEFDPDRLEAQLAANVLNLLRGGEDYYDRNFPSEDLYWLSRIIYAEARDQPLAGLIAVGNVVLNRVECDYFPHTVIDVIYDRDGTIQFDPAAAGALGEPDDISVIAACLCLEGYNTAGDCMYFVNPDSGDAVWFDKELEFVMSIGDHDFYRSRDDA